MSKTLEGVLIKRPHQKLSYTDQQVKEMLSCMDPISGPEYFMSNFFHIQHPTRGQMLYQPFEYQKQLIHTYHNYRFSISMMPRQSGKCLRGDTTFINIKNKHTGEIKRVSLEEFYQMQDAVRRSKQV